MKTVLNYVSNSIKGLNRNINQDRILVIDSECYYIFIVFDGVSSLTDSYNFIEEYIRRLKINIKGLLPNGENLDIILFDTHQEVLKIGFEGMSTIALLYYDRISDVVKYLNIGDSRIYQFSNQFIEKITRDDSFNEKSNVLLKCLGLNDLSIADFKLSKVTHQHNFLLCTDGFYKLMVANLKAYFTTCNFQRIGNIRKKFENLQKNMNNDDSSYILVKR